MCGIAAIFSYHRDAKPADRVELSRIANQMGQQGTTGQGQWLDAEPCIGLAHRQLATTNLSADAGQPMAAADGQFRIVFTGEIYNSRELRAELQARGHRFRTQSDTEVLLRLYMDRGADMLIALRGMFAMVIWDANRGGMLLARDHFGIKPLYVHDDGRSYRVASQIQALLAGGGFESQVEPAGQVGFYLWGSVPEPYTWYRNVFSVPAGHSVWVDHQGARTPVCYFHLVDELELAQQQSLAGRTAAETLQEVLRDSVSAHLPEDQPAGVFLSDGEGSSVIAGLAAQRVEHLQTLALAFDGADDEPLSAQAAARHGCSHQVATLSRQDVLDQRSAILASMDQPSVGGVETWLAAKEAAALGWKVALSDLGSDALLGGYPNFRQLPRLVALGRWPARLPGFGRGFRYISAPVLRHLTVEKYAGLFEYGGSMGGAYLLRRGLYMPWELPSVLDTEIIKQGWQSLQPIIQLDRQISGLKRSHAQVGALELSFHLRNQLLRDSDWAGRAHGIQIRMPLTDIAVFRAMAPYLVVSQPPMKSMLTAVPARPLPPELDSREPPGLPVPIESWLAEATPANEFKRGLGNWATHVVSEFPHDRNPRRLRVYGVFSDAFGVCGGIGRFNQNLMQAVCSMPEVERFDVVIRNLPQRRPTLPYKMSVLAARGQSLLVFLWEWLRSIQTGPPSLVLCGHLNLLPMAAVVARFRKVPLWCILHGAEAWQPHHRRLINSLLSRVDQYVIVSETTKERFISWSKVPKGRCVILENSYDPQQWQPGAKSPELEQRYGVAGKKVILTVARMFFSERNKGHDELIDLMPELLKVEPDLVYLIVGEGTDRSRLQRKVAGLGLQQYVKFSGYIDDAEKADHYRLADVFAMPGRREGFGIVYLEAMASGIPVIGSTLDGSRDALRDGELGRLVHPDHRDELRTALLAALRQGRGSVPATLSQFQLAGFNQRVEQLLKAANLPRASS